VDEPISGGKRNFVHGSPFNHNCSANHCVNQKETTTALARVEIVAARSSQGVLSAHCSMMPGARMLSENDLIGSWRLAAHYYLDDDGSTSEGPMGDQADGLLIYHEDGYMAASLMRTSPLTTTNGTLPPAYLGSRDDYIGYSGRWHVRDDTVVHEVIIGSHHRVVHTEQARQVQVGESGLQLTRRLDGPHDYVVMDWRRARGGAS